jgi:arsenite-transporting ATPase
LTSGQLVLFGGKGGVGKTTCATAWALGRAAAGERTLIVSTDPAHSLGDALDVRLSSRPRRVLEARGELWALEQDADAALSRWLKRHRDLLRDIVTRGTYLDDADVDELLRLSLPGVDELMGLLELQRLTQDGWDTVVVDTAPTGHTLRLLQTPEAWRDIAEVLDDMQEKHRVIAQSLARSYAADRADALIDELDARGAKLAALLRDARHTRLHWVALPEPMVVAETGRALAALREEGLHVDRLWVNRITPPPSGRCDLCGMRRREERGALKALSALGSVRTIGACERPPRGVRELGRFLDRRVISAPSPPRTAAMRRSRAGARAAWELLAPTGVRLVCFGGKGGVGKTTCAAATALAAARAQPKRRILLLSVDPAHSVGDALGTRAGNTAQTMPGGPQNLQVRELDAEADFRARRDDYRTAVDELFDALRGGSRLDAALDRQVTQDLIELSPPGIDELFGLLGVIDALDPRERGVLPPFDLVVLDTAPTGHALRLLALPEKALEWVHALMSLLLKYRATSASGRLGRDLLAASRSLKRLSQLLGDPERTRFVAVTRAEELPRLETRRLLAALRKARIPVGALVVNALTPSQEDATPGRACRRCQRAAVRERAMLSVLAHDSGSSRRRLPFLAAPAVAPPPHDLRTLERWIPTWKLL